MAFVTSPKNSIEDNAPYVRILRIPEVMQIERHWYDLGEMNNLDKSGWAQIDTGLENETLIERALLEIARSLGTITTGSRSRQAVEKLTPKSIEQANEASLSKKFGLGPLPFHIDTAHWPVPGRYVILACALPGSDQTPTLLADRTQIRFSVDEENAMRAGIFFVTNGSHSFYSSILGDNQNFARVDPGCMVPISDLGIHALRCFSGERFAPIAKEVTWRRGTILVIDNWRALHGRASAKNGTGSRILLRAISI